MYYYDVLFEIFLSTFVCLKLPYYIYIIYILPSGFEADCVFTLIDKTDASEPLRREQFWITKLQTLQPNGLNMEECV